MQFINTLTVLALVVASFALIVAVPVLYLSLIHISEPTRPY